MEIEKELEQDLKKRREEACKRYLDDEREHKVYSADPEYIKKYIEDGVEVEESLPKFSIKNKELPDSVRWKINRNDLYYLRENCGRIELWFPGADFPEETYEH